MKKFRLLFDMDGTLANLYSREGWLETLRKEKPIFLSLETMPDYDLILSQLATLKAITTDEIEIIIVSWTPMHASQEYADRCQTEKLLWLSEKGFMELADGAYIPQYGTRKSIYASKEENVITILFDDNSEVRAEFTEFSKCQAFDENQIVNVLPVLIELFK